MKYRTSELEGALLDAAVAKAEGKVFILEGFGRLSHLSPACWTDGNEFDESRQDCWALFQPSTDPRDGHPIIERERISLHYEPPADLYNEWGDQPERSGVWKAKRAPVLEVAGPTALVAAMRTYIRSKFGEEVEL